MNKAKILIVEDDADIRLGLNVRLRKEGYETVLVGDALAALATAQREKPDLILLDLGLPGGDGSLLLERLKKQPNSALIPVIVLTGRDPQRNKSIALNLGAVAFLQKPVFFDDLLSTIADHLSDLPSRSKIVGQDKKILIVEDDPDTRLGLSIRLQKEGFKTVVASDAIMAVTVARREQPDLILLDLGLPAGDGFKVLANFQNVDVLAAIPVIVVSARDLEVNGPRALNAGARAYFAKPPPVPNLLQTIRHELSQ